MKFLHTMIRVLDLEKSLDFFVNKLGLVELRRKENEKGRFTLISVPYTHLDVYKRQVTSHSQKTRS